MAHRPLDPNTGRPIPPKKEPPAKAAPPLKPAKEKPVTSGTATKEEK